MLDTSQPENNAPNRSVEREAHTLISITNSITGVYKVYKSCKLASHYTNKLSEFSYVTVRL